MAKFQLERLVQTESFTYRAGTKAEPLTDADRGKAVKLGAANQVVLAGPDDEILGFLSSIEPGTHDGFKIGGVQEQDYQEVDTGTAAVGDLVVVDSNPARGTEGLTKVKKAASADLFKWLVVRPGLVKRI